MTIWFLAIDATPATMNVSCSLPSPCTPILRPVLVFRNRNRDNGNGAQTRIKRIYNYKKQLGAAQMKISQASNEHAITNGKIDNQGFNEQFICRVSTSS
jgi:hypothetical protein